MSSVIFSQRFDYKIILYILLITLLPLIALAIIITWLDSNSLKDSLNEPLQILTCNQLNRVNDKTFVIENFVYQIESIVEKNSIQGEEFTREINTAIEHNSYSPLLGLAIFFEAENPVLFGSMSENPLDESLVEWAQTNNGPQVIWQTKENTSYASKISLVEDQEYILVASVPLTFLQETFSNLPPTSGYYLLDEHDQLLLYSDSPIGKFPVQNYLSSSTSTRLIVHEDLQATICSSSNNWRLALVLPINFSVANRDLLTNILLITILVIAFVVVLFAFFFNQKLIQPIKIMSDRMVKINNNDELDLKIMEEGSYTGEVHALVSEFNQVVKNFKATQNKISLLEEKQERIEFAIQGSKIGIWDWNLRDNHCYFSPIWRSILGHTEESIHNLPTEWFTRVHPEDIETLRSEINNHIEGKTPIFESEHRIRHLNDSYIWVYTRGLVRKNSDGNTKRFVGIMENITQRKLLEAKLMITTMYDPLTGLPNRTYFLEIIEQSLGRIRRRDEYHSAILYLDLDHFKNINDKFSFSAGDALLLEITRRLKFGLRSMDTVARLGEDKFGIILEEINGLPDTIKITRRLYKEITKPFTFSKETIYPGTSIGIVMISRGYQDANEVLRDAESAMFQAKSNGRGKFEVFDKENYSYVLSKIRIENELRNAIKKNEIILNYQPVIDTNTNQVVNADTIAIWQHPEKGIVPNEHYFSIAEESGEIIPLNIYILRNACIEAIEWQIEKNLRTLLSVPISPKLLLKPDLTEIVLSALADSNLPNTSLQLVITESSKIYNSGIAIQSMVNLSSIGIKFCLSDYGVIPSSLEQLKRLPIHAIRISETLTRDLPTNEEDAEITESIISIAKILKLQVISTGIETKEQYDFLISKGISHISGDFLSKAKAKSEFIKYLNKS